MYPDKTKEDASAIQPKVIFSQILLNPCSSVFICVHPWLDFRY